MFETRNFLFVVLILSSLCLKSQPRFSCDSLKNTFLTSGQKASIVSLVDTIYPNGMIYYKRDSALYFSDLMSIMNIDTNLTFTFSKRTLNLLDSSECFFRYQEYYKGILVVGGGYTEAYYIHGGGPSNPCLEPISSSPYIFSGIDLDIDDARPISSIADSLGLTLIDTSDLYIFLNMFDDCEYGLYYRVTYLDTNSHSVECIVNGVSGQILGEINSMNPNKQAKTRDFDIQEMKDSQLDANTTWLVSSDGLLKTYDYQFRSYYYDGVKEEIKSKTAPEEEYIPTVSYTSPNWTEDVDFETTYQTHYLAGEMIDWWKSEFNYTFPECRFMAHVNWSNGGYYDDDDLNFRLFLIGDYTYPGGVKKITFAWPGVIAHELTHAFLHGEGLGYDSNPEFPPNDYTFPNGSLHEAISDMVSVYLKSKFYNDDISWVAADENGYSDGRDFQNPQYDCFTEVENYKEHDAYERGDPLRYWFYLCVNGNATLDIPAINAKTVLEIVLNSIHNMTSTSDYVDLMNATLNYAIANYSRCSEEFIALARAWEAICVPTGYTNPNTNDIGECDFSLEGPVWVCEESNYMDVTLVDAITTYHYIWTLIGQKSTEYESTFNMTGNGQYGGLNIELIQFPTHDYYPQKLTIKVYCPELGSQYIMKHSVILDDCQNDDPTCQQFYDPFVINVNNNPIESENSDLGLVNEINSYNQDESFINNSDVIIYSLLGEHIYTGPISKFNFKSYPQNALFIIVHYNHNGKIVKVEKKIFFE